MVGKTSLILKTSFDSAHCLPGYKGACANLHGHTWNVEVTVTGPIDPVTNMIIDFTHLKSVVKGMLPDHKFLNDAWPDFYPTAENIARRLCDHINEALPPEVVCMKVLVWETVNQGAIYEVVL